MKSWYFVMFLNDDKLVELEVFLYLEIVIGI